MSSLNSFVLIGTLLLSAFAFSASLAWNEAIKEIISNYYPKKGGGILPNIVYALVMTGILITVAFLLIRFSPKAVKKVLN